MAHEKATLDQLRIDRTDDPSRGTGPAFWLILLLLLGLAGAGAWWWRGRGVEVRVATVRESAPAGSSRTLLNASGYVTARREATVSSKVTGKIMEVFIEEGMKVKAGQVLAKLDETNVQASLNLARAQFNAASALLKETGVRLQLAEREFKRFTELARDKVANEAELDRADADVKSLKARLEQQAVDITVAERQVALWQQQLDDLIIRAPFDGVVTSKDAQPGEMISPVSAGGGFTRTGICTIVDMDSLEVDVDVNESYINRVEAGKPVESRLDAYPDWKIPGKVIAIVPTADRQKATVQVRVGFEKLDPRILPHMGVKVAFLATGEEKVTAVFTVPKTALQRQEGRDQVLVVKDGRIEPRPVTLSPSGGAEGLVSAGIAAGEKVVIEPTPALKPGTRVREARR